MTTPSRFPTVCAALACALACLAPAAAEASESAISARLGTNWSLLSRPNDPEGEPTLLSGSAFDGHGLLGGGTFHYSPGTVAGTPVEFESGLWFGRHVAEGFEEAPSGDARRLVTLKTGILRVPLMAHLRSGEEDLDMRFGAGLEALVGLYSEAEVDHEHTSEEPERLHTTPTTHLAATAAVGLDWQAGGDWFVPMEVRGSWAPLVPGNTRDRFEDYESIERPGAYKVGFDWQLLFVTGVRYEL